MTSPGRGGRRPARTDIPEPTRRALQQIANGVRDLRRTIVEMRVDAGTDVDLGALRRQVQAVADVIDRHTLDDTGTESVSDLVLTRAKALAADLADARLNPERPEDLRAIRWRLQNMTDIVDSHHSDPRSARAPLDQVIARTEALANTIAAMRLSPNLPDDLREVHHLVRGTAALVNEHLRPDTPASPAVEVE